MQYNEKGSSIIQVMVAAGIASVIALAVAQMMSNQNKEVKALGQKLSTKDLEQQMNRLFANSDYCNCTFNSKTFDMTQTPPVIVAADQFTLLVDGYSVPTPTCTAVGSNFIPTVGTTVSGSTLTVGSIGLGSLTQVSPGIYKADLSVSFNNSIRSMQPIKTNVQFAINMGGGSANARPFVSCSGAGGSAASIWTKNPDDTIFYNAANVGIGTSTPTEKLDIVGNISIPTTTTTVGMIKMGGSRFIHAYGTDNFFAGIIAGNSTMTGSGNTGVGKEALMLNTTGALNVAIGLSALDSNTTGNANIAIGFASLSSNVGGFRNIAIGSLTLQNNTSGGSNVGIGGSATLLDNTTGDGNVAIGESALGNNTTGIRNVAVGTSSNVDNDTGSENTAVGYFAKSNAPNLSNTTAIGARAFANANNSVRIGNAAITLIEGQVGWTATSDARLKRDVQPYAYGLDFVRKLRPVSFTFKSDGTRQRQMGFIAQEVEAIRLPFYGLKKPTSEKGYYSLTYSDFVMPLVNSVQELERENTILHNEITTLRNEMDAKIQKILETLDKNSR